MIQHYRQLWFRVLVLCVATLFLVSCGGNDGSELFESDGRPKLADTGFQREQGEVMLAVTGGQTVTESNAGREGALDITYIANGYVGASVRADTTAKFGITNTGTGEHYEYELDTNGNWCFYPISYGDGNYRFNIYLHQSGDMYEDFLSYEQGVALVDERAPFLVQNQVVNYGADSAVVALGRELSANCGSDMEVIRQVYWWVCGNISYDTGKAANINSYGAYVPNLDEILSLRSGICYDYASLAAALLRSNGIPTKLKMGNVNDGEGGTVYHAWNEVWTADTGWIAVKFEVKGGAWNRVDTTFAAASDTSIAQFIGDGSNYYETSVH